jgi:hypothetical protein
MIKIETIKPLGSNSSLPIHSLKTDFLNVIDKFNHIPQLLVAIEFSDLDGVSLSYKQIECLQFICENYKKIILGSPLELERIIKTFDNRGWNKEINNGKTRTPFGVALTKVFGYKHQFRSSQKHGVWFASKMNIKVCPYCNSQYTLVVNRKNKGTLAKFQFDHFFPLEKFPYLSVSLYNIIPSCAACNHKKSNTRLWIKDSYHPYYNSIGEFSEFKVIFPGNVEKLSFPQLLSMDIDRIRIQFVSKFSHTKKMIEQHDALFDISAVYTRHKDIAHTIMIQSTLRNRYYQKSVMKIRGLFPDESTMIKYILGASVNIDDSLNKPLSKFTQDIARKLNLIK